MANDNYHEANANVMRDYLAYLVCVVNIFILLILII